MTNPYNLHRFVTAQEQTYPEALAEIRRGRKTSHWMWFIFPQLAGLGYSETAKYYAIQHLDEAAAYLAHNLLGHRLIEISTVLLGHEGKTAHQIFGSPDDLKLRSSMTLFSVVASADPVFGTVLATFFGGQKDIRTVSLLQQL